ncbi:hypothetical protein Pelo_1191 [Pelomyxa schiedti]|nr:hypothetical protein Pelo_1191 [Pelomyxa schiedti]
MVTVYDGEWHNNQRHGHGMWRAPDTGTIYCGEWDHDAMSGTGRMLIGDRSPNNDSGGSYVGGMKDGKFHGEGVRVWSNGDRYRGAWEGDKEHGKGTKRWARDGSSFIGEWDRGVPAKGTMEWPNGDKFTGTFAEETGGAQHSEMRRYHGEGLLSLSSLNCQDGGSHQLKGTLQGNIFHGAEGAALHVMGSSLPQLGHSQLIQQVKEEHNKEREIERKEWNAEKTELQNKLKITEKNLQELINERDHIKEQLLVQIQHAKELQSKQKDEEDSGTLLAVPNEMSNDDKMQPGALSELNMAFKIATKFRSQLKKAAPQLVALEDTVSTLKKFLQSATERNQALDLHTRELTTLREALEKAVEESDTRCKEILGQTLRVESNEPEIQQCTRNISSLMKKVMGTKPPSPNGEVPERIAVPSKDINNLMTLKPWLLLKTLEPPPSSAPESFTTLLREITETAIQIHGGSKFDSCKDLIEQYTLFHKECNSQTTLGQSLNKEIEELLKTCQGLSEAYQHKYMLMRGLEGDDQFMAHPDVWSQLSELLPHALQSVMDVMLSKCTSSSAQQQSQPPPPPSPTTKTQQPGGTSTSSATSDPRSNSNSNNNQHQQQGGLSDTGMMNTCNMSSTSMECIVCDERPRNIRFHPCGHGVCCSECASNVRKCPFCRAPILQKQKLFL